MFAAATPLPSLSNASSASRSLRSSQRRREGKEAGLYTVALVEGRSLQKRTARQSANQPLVKRGESTWLQNAPSTEGWRNFVVTGLVPRHSVKLDIIRSPLNFCLANFLSSVWCQKLLRTSRKQICTSRVQVLELCRSQGRHIWCTFLESPTYALSRPKV